MPDKQALLQELEALQTEIEHIGNAFNDDGIIDDQEKKMLEELLSHLDIVKKEAHALKEKAQTKSRELAKDSPPDSGLSLKNVTNHADRLNDDKLKQQEDQKKKAQETADRIKNQSFEQNRQEASDYLERQRQHLDGIDSQKKAIKNAEKDPNTKPEDLQKMRDELQKRTEAYVEENGGSNRTTKGGSGSIEGGWNANFSDQGLKISAFITPAYDYDIKSPSYPVPGVPGLFLDLGFNFKMAMEGKIEALLDMALLTQLGGGSAPGSFEDAGALFRKSINNPELGSLTLSGTFKPSISGSVSLGLSLAKLIKIKFVGKLEASVELGVSTKLHQKDGYLFGSVSGGLEASASLEIGPSDEAAAIIGAFSKDVLNSLSYTIPLGDKAELVKISSKKPTHDQPKALFENVEMSKGKALVDIENALKAFYETITQYVNIVGDSIKAVGKAAVQVVEGVEHLYKMSKSLNHLCNCSISTKESGTTYLYGSNVWFTIKFGLTKRLALSEGMRSYEDYQVYFNAALWFGNVKVDSINTRNIKINHEGDNYTEDFFESLGHEKYPDIQAIIAKLYRKYGKVTLEQTPFVLKSELSVNGEKERLTDVPIYMRFPDDFDFTALEQQ